MQRHQFKTEINAPREIVWQVLWNNDTYPQWTAPFSEGSHAISDWKRGSKVLFLGSESSGMVSRVADVIPNEYMSFEHLGEVKDGVEDTESEKVKKWAGAHENYTLKDLGGKTELITDIDLDNEFADMFINIFPKALAKVKEI